MIKTIYKCDCCGKEWDRKSTDEKICSVYIGVSIGKTETVSFDKYNSKQQQWCRSCVMSKGIRDPIIDDDEKLAPEKPLSFEEKFSLLVDELGFIRE